MKKQKEKINFWNRKEVKFYTKLFRNSLILTLGYFISVWAMKDGLAWLDWKQILIFLATYLIFELTYHYKIKKDEPIDNHQKIVNTLIF